MTCTVCGKTNPVVYSRINRDSICYDCLEWYMGVSHYTFETSNQNEIDMIPFMTVAK